MIVKKGTTVRWFDRVGARLVWPALMLVSFSLLSGCGGGDGSGGKAISIGKPVERGDNKLGKVIASPQRVANGSYVVIDKVVLPKGGYVAIYADGKGAPGRRLGVSKLLSAGTTKNVRVTLNPKLTSKTVVHAMLHAEDNKDKTFDFPKHDAPLGSGGGVIEAAFKVEVK